MAGLALPLKHVADYAAALLIAYYVVGIILFVRELGTIPENDPGVAQYIREMETESTLSFAWTTTKLVLAIALVHIPLWIFRV